MSQISRRRPAGALRSAAACLALGVLAAGCQDRPICPVIPRVTSIVTERLVTSRIDRVDLLLAIDSSTSMRDKQALLSLAVPDLVQGLVNPPCVDASGAPAEPAAKGPLDPCPEGAARPFEPILDVHVGVITSSLGAHGADACPTSGPGVANPSNDDRGHLVFRTDPLSGGALPTYQDRGFLAWDPAQELAPPGEADLFADSAADPGDVALLPVLREMITGVGDVGCGYESQLESIHRFLVEPSPHAALAADAAGEVTPEGVDEELLAQRKAFLRPDSLLAIVLLTDENDCSVKEYGQYNVVLRQKNGDGTAFRMPRARAVCATDPGDACCFSCAQAGPKDASGAPLCPEDPTCTDGDGGLARLGADEDPIGLRCWDQKRRFGVDFLYPIERYTRGLTEPTVLDRDGREVPNPIFSDLDPDDAITTVRGPGMVVLTGLAGVPWQDVARDPLDLREGFKDADELFEPGPSGRSAWEVILGDPESGVPPADPLMIEDVHVRSGVSPVTGEPVATEQTPLASSVNGHDFNGPYLLQYACIFDLPEPLDCSDPAACGDPKNSPVYDPPYDQDPMTQVRAGARPGTRILSLLRSLGHQGVVASACPAQTSDPDAADFGYRPAISAALRRLRTEIEGRCFPRKLTVDEGGQVACVLVEARRGDGGACCDPAEARVPVPEEKQAIVDYLAADATVLARGYDCFCEVPQLSGGEPGGALYACQNDPSGAPVLASGETVDGFCYVDATGPAPIGSPELVAACPDTEKRAVRFTGKGKPGRDALLFITCGSAPEPLPEGCSP